MRLEDYLKEINYIEKVDAKEVVNEERTCKGDYRKHIAVLKAEKETQDNLKKREAIKERMEKNAYARAGRPSMARSQKKAQKKVVEKKSVDQETLDRKKYLGDVEI